MGNSVNLKERERLLRVDMLANRFAENYEDHGLAFKVYKAGYNQALKDFSKPITIGNDKEGDGWMKTPRAFR